MYAAKGISGQYQSPAIEHDMAAAGDCAYSSPRLAFFFGALVDPGLEAAAAAAAVVAVAS